MSIPQPPGRALLQTTSLDATWQSLVQQGLLRSLQTLPVVKRQLAVQQSSPVRPTSHCSSPSTMKSPQKAVESASEEGHEHLLKPGFVQKEFKRACLQCQILILLRIAALTNSSFSNSSLFVYAETVTNRFSGETRTSFRLIMNAGFQ